MKTLFVYFHSRKIGMLTQDSIGKYSFQYDPEWIREPSAHALSQSLPLREEAYEEKDCANHLLDRPKI